MKKIFCLLILVLAVIGFGVMGFFSFYVGASSSLPEKAAIKSDLAKQGDYLAKASDCVACHTAPDGAPFAGGLGMASPIGTIYSSNITPDKTGIGGYSLQDFDLTVRHGVRPDGVTLYPAMPYPSYAIMTDGDIEALYAYFMQDVTPVLRANQGTDILWPLSMRWPLTGWRLFFAPEVAAFAEGQYSDPVVARGAYLIQGPGHCGACHTPRAITMNEKAYSEKGGSGALYLSGSGGPLDGWVAVNLRGDHKDGLGSVSEAQLAMLLKTGRNDHSAVFGGMADVINHSLQYMSDDDIRAMARYLKQLSPAQQGENPPFVYDESTRNALASGDVSKPGALFYIDSCAACHRTDGKGYAQTFPALAGNPVLQSDNAASLVAIIVKGFRLEGTKDAPTAYSMPPLGWRYSEKELTDLVNFVRHSWGNQGAVVTESEVRNIMKTLHQE